MAKEKQCLLLLLPPLLLLLLLTLPSPSLSLSETSLNAAITSLRSNGYTLFGNAILTSDLYTDLLRNGSASFTLFAPTDPSLFTLDLSSRADLYVSSLRRHVAVGRLQSLTPPFPNALPSLLPDHPVSLSLVNGSEIVTANGVVIIAPRIFDAPDLTVHGLAGMLPVRFAYSPSISPTSSSTPSISPTLSSPPSISPTLRSPPSIAPSLSSQPSTSHTMSSPPSTAPTPRSPPSMAPRLSSPPAMAPSSLSSPPDRVVEAPMAQLDQISMPPKMARLSLDEISPAQVDQNQISMPPEMARLSFDEISPSPMVLRNGEEWWCLTGEVEEGGCFKVRADLGLASPPPIL